MSVCCVNKTLGVATILETADLGYVDVFSQLRINVLALCPSFLTLIDDQFISVSQVSRSFSKTPSIETLYRHDLQYSQID